MPIAAADPRAKELDAQFAAAMSGPAKPRSEPKAPKEIDPEAPFGRDDSGEPIAKYGKTVDGRIRRSAGGRKPKKGEPDAARVTDKPDPPAGTGEPAKTGTVVDYSQDLADAADGIWLVMTGAARLPLGRLRAGKIGLPADAGDRMAAQAFVFSQHKYRLAAALNEAAQHNARARRLADKLAGGDMSWVLTVGALGMPFVMHSLALWRSDAGQLAKMELPAIGELAKNNEALMGQYMSQLTMAAAMIQAQADAAAPAPA